MIKNNTKKAIRILFTVMLLMLVFTAYTGCGVNQTSATAGTLILKVNPEFEIAYDEKGDVVSIMPMNEDAGILMEQITGYEGKPVKEVIPDLVKLIDKEGYINKQTKGEGKNINIEVKYGSSMPDETFLQDIVSNVKVIFDDKQVTGKVVVSGESNYGISQYEVSDYGNTDYKSAKSSIDKAVKKGNSYTDYGDTDYDGYNSDYGSNTDYDGTNTDYNSNYNNSAYDSNSDYKSPTKPTFGTTTKPTSGANSNYSNYESNYGESSYDDSRSNYDNDSDYDD